MELFMLLKCEVWAHFHCAADSLSLRLLTFSFASAGLPFHKPVTRRISECMESKSCYCYRVYLYYFVWLTPHRCLVWKEIKSKHIALFSLSKYSELLHFTTCRASNQKMSHVKLDGVSFEVAIWASIKRSAALASPHHVTLLPEHSMVVDKNLGRATHAPHAPLTD